ncbi:helix-turn-helix transcriptional regulator [Methyloligella solikamskensis]|uniref:Helix-turn-helix transcriptional regulator n=1 Tax=Methyloligella solikamskensis TaxID=1177756 RepID=A0ABW3JFE7_9HYPH
MAGSVSFALSSRIDARHVRMARAGLGLSVRDLAERAGVNKATIVRLEAGMPVRGATTEAVKAALEAEGACFYINDQGTICVSVPARK